MLLVTSMKHPGINNFKHYLTQNGGGYTTDTYLDNTSFSFNVNPEKFEDALDRFSEFFKDPLFLDTMIDENIDSIDSEFRNNMSNDFKRLHQLDKSSSKPDHAYSKFGFGNKFTLYTVPRQNSINVRDEILKFFEQYYSANIMSLSVLGKGRFISTYWKLKIYNTQ